MGAVGLGKLALARGTLDRMAERRGDEAWLRRAWADPRSRVVVIDEGDALVRFADPPSLVLVRPREVADDTERYLLGVGPDGAPYFAVTGALPAVDGGERASLRRVGALLGDRDAGLFTHALALSNWHATHAYCPRCGGRTRLASAGHVRVCPADGSEHFPRVDPAVIMLVHDGRDRVLLARGPAWPRRQMSILAGFVEPGESLEQAVVREVREEVGITVGRVRYLGSQPWPLPRSLMLGFFARADDGQALRPDTAEIAEAHWFTRTGLREAEDSGEVRLPGPLSIARHLLDAWWDGGPRP
jgi:NAD+ diphosphatase